MRKILSFLILCFAMFSAQAYAQSGSRPTGVFLTTDYPSLTLQPGTTSNISLTLANRGVAPSRMALRVTDVPAGWKATLLGGGQPVSAAMPGTDNSVLLQLRVEVPADAPKAPHTLTVLAEGPAGTVRLPIDVALADQLPAKLVIDSKLPALRGGPSSSFDYQFSLRNDSGKDLLVTLGADAPQYFDTSFTEGYGTQQLTSVPVKAGESKDMKLSVRPPSNVKPGSFPIKISAQAQDASANADLSLEIIGQPSLRISGRDGLMSADATAGTASTVPVVIQNDGSAPAANVELSATAPNGWEIEFEPKTIDQIAAGGHAEAQAKLTPSKQSLAGDYMATVRASSGGQSASGDFRITVHTSTLWGIAGAVIIAIAVLVLVGAVARFGRR
ncbi:NEW3 domain-containing protein [Pigmentiphaga soli]|uniref:NEW3 domain-containing protein n=1 Tax=Pigmentiphaga soli TaxID=1007095 RepID=A0ABP8H3J9_9BURK